MQNYQSLLAQLANAQPVSNRIPFITAGDHVLAVVKYATTKSTKYGDGLGCTLLVMQSTTIKPGSLVFEAWYPGKPQKFPGSNQEVDRACDFAQKLFGVDAPTASGYIGELLANEDAQPAKGILIKCNANEKPATATAKAFTHRNWEHIPQTAEQIKGQRSIVDQQAQNPTPAAPAPVAAPASFGAPAQAPAPQFAAPSAPANGGLAALLGVR